jgi:hypothetical protein
VDPGTLELNDQDYVFNDNHGFARPVLDTNARGDVGLGFAWGGGNKWYASQGVGFLTGKREFWATLENDADASGVGATDPHGDYATIRAGWPRGNCFVTPAVGWRSSVGVARIVAFGRAADQRCGRPGFQPLSHIVTFDGISDGTLITTQTASAGATFGSASALGFPGGQPRHTCPDGPTASAGTAVAPDCPSSTAGLRDTGLVAKLTASARVVSVRIGATQAQPGGFAADMDGYDANGNRVAGNAVLVGSSTNGQGAGPVQSLTIQAAGSAAPIAYVVLSFDGSFSSGSRLVFDDLTYTST